MYNNDGQILYRFADSGVEDESATDTEYAYANGHPVGSPRPAAAPGAEVGNFIGRGIRERFGGRQEELLEQVAGDLANSLIKPEQIALQQAIAQGDGEFLFDENGRPRILLAANVDDPEDLARFRGTEGPAALGLVEGEPERSSGKALEAFLLPEPEVIDFETATEEEIADYERSLNLIRDLNGIIAEAYNRAIYADREFDRLGLTDKTLVVTGAVLSDALDSLVQMSMTNFSDGDSAFGGQVS